MAKKKTTQKFIKEATNVHKGKYDYSASLYSTNHSKLRIICRSHGEFLQTPANHLQGQGCPICAGTMKSNTTEFIIKAEKIHGKKYDYSKSIYKTTMEKIEIVCSKHGSFRQVANDHLRGAGCKKCSYESRGRKRSLSKKDFVSLAENVHGNRYEYSEYSRYFDKVRILCLKHGEFFQTPANHLQGHGCPKCSNTFSKGEMELFDFLTELLPTDKIHTRDKTVISPQEIDIYIPGRSLAIEYCGLYWHSELAGKDRLYHLRKLDECSNKGIRLITVFEDEWIHKKDIVKSRLKNLLGAQTYKIHARKCVVEEIDTKRARNFIEKYHIQGYVGSFLKLGLFHEDELVAVMTFSKASRAKGNRHHDIVELSRYCASTKVVGGAGKLFKHFTKSPQARNFTKVISYADLRWNTGDMYTKIGFEQGGRSGPNYWYFVPGGTKRTHRFKYRKRSTDVQTISEWENRKQEGLNRIWDCGNLRFTYTI